MRRARRRGLAHEAADRIRDAIFEGLVQPGAALREVELATSLEVSRGSVREGLAILEREGLVRSEWHRGARVIDMSPADVDEVYTVRAALERLATGTAADRATPERLAELSVLTDALERALASGTDAPTLLSLDMAFHDRVYEIAGNDRLTQAWYGVRSQVYLFQLTRIRLGHAQYRSVVVEEHRQMVRMLERGDTRALTEAAEEHVDSARRALVRMLAAPRQEPRVERPGDAPA
ncbi:GntR family transcriptional regulator [Nocardiopsis sp. TSRI0078]|uniref:GntR family transcriptional regulator n=1 Tax=unclassified Nocardiopsis TaxID=2649073 RepID=UPI000939DA76|nr:GntR family transcriptional regulator [Nocardiopsis sp. TSRI0078]OKI12389.1 GntR family transcriptional regulator [Nocardiopsis sp. TSRI0078]